MLEQTKIRQIAREVATTSLPRSVVRDVLIEPAIGFMGDEILQITILIEPDAVSRIAGDAAATAAIQMQDRMLEAGEERFPVVSYATEEELQESGDP
jgi:hypothetical protein